MKSINLQELEKESRGVFNEDGLLYVSIGLLLLLVGASFLFRPLLILVAFGALLIFPLEAIRQHLTYPRLGYAKFKAPPGTLRGILIFAILTMLFLTLIAFIGDGRFQRILPFAYSSTFTLAFYFGMSTQGLRTADWLLMGIMLLAGLLASLLFPDWHDGTAVLFTFTGLLFIIFGLIRLVHFLRTVPLLDQGNGQ